VTVAQKCACSDACLRSNRCAACKNQNPKPHDTVTNHERLRNMAALAFSSRACNRLKSTPRTLRCSAPKLSSTAAPARSAPACAVSRVRRPDPVRGTAYARASCLLRRRCRRPFFTIRRISSATVDRREALWSVHVSTLFNSDKPYTNYLIRGVIIGQRFMREQQPKQRGRQRPVSPPLPPTLCTAR
jgi:hypothetical protein